MIPCEDAHIREGWRWKPKGVGVSVRGSSPCPMPSPQTKAHPRRAPNWSSASLRHAGYFLLFSVFWINRKLLTSDKQLCFNTTTIITPLKRASEQGSAIGNRKLQNSVMFMIWDNIWLKKYENIETMGTFRFTPLPPYTKSAPLNLSLMFVRFWCIHKPHSIKFLCS